MLIHKNKSKKLFKKGININKEWAHIPGKVVSTKGFRQVDVVLQASVSTP